jgi:two-component system response regulator RegA
VVYDARLLEKQLQIKAASMSFMESAMSAEPKEIKILIVDDDETIRSRLTSALSRRGYEAQEADGYNAAMNKMRSFRPDYVVTDLRMPEHSGLEVVEGVKRVSPGTEVLLLTGFGSIANALEAVRKGARGYLTKPADTDQILIALGLQEVSEEKDVSDDGLQPLEQEPYEFDDEDCSPTLGRVEWEHIQRVLTDCDNNISRAARALGMHRRTLQRKLSYNPPSR